MNLNKVFLIGRLTRDPEVRTTPSGQTVANVGLATNRVWADASGRKESTEFHNIVFWGKLAEIVSNYLKKGALVMVEGRLQTRSWQDQSGNKRYATEVVAEGMQMGPRSAGGGTSGGYGSPSSSNMSRSAPVSAKSGPEPEIPIIDENEPLHAGIESGVDEDEMKIKESDLPF